MEITESYRNKLFMYLNSFDINVERDLLEVDEYDHNYMVDCYKQFQSSVENFYNTCKAQERKDIGFRYDCEWFDVKYNVYYSQMIKTYGSLENCPTNIKNELLAFNKFDNYSPFYDPYLTFGKVIGRTTDRYDYFMFLKCGLVYEPKYITKEHLRNILKENKYGYSAHCIF